MIGALIKSYNNEENQYGNNVKFITKENSESFAEVDIQNGAVLMFEYLMATQD